MEAGKQHSTVGNLTLHTAMLKEIALDLPSVLTNQTHAKAADRKISTSASALSLPQVTHRSPESFLQVPEKTNADFSGKRRDSY